MKTIALQLPLRPCLVKGKKHLFHCWDHIAQPVDASPLRGGHPGGQMSMTMALVEDEQGQVHEVYPGEVTFVDSEISQYSFGPDDVSQEEEGE